MIPDEVLIEITINPADRQGWIKKPFKLKEKRRIQTHV